MSEHHIEIVVAAEGMVPGKPVHDYRRLIIQKRPGLSPRLDVGTKHPLGVDDGFGVSG